MPSLNNGSIIGSIFGKGTVYESLDNSEDDNLYNLQLHIDDNQTTTPLGGGVGIDPRAQDPRHDSEYNTSGNGGLAIGSVTETGRSGRRDSARNQPLMNSDDSDESDDDDGPSDDILTERRNIYESAISSPPHVNHGTRLHPNYHHTDNVSDEVQEDGDNEIPQSLMVEPTAKTTVSSGATLGSTANHGTVVKGGHGGSDISAINSNTTLHQMSSPKQARRIFSANDLGDQPSARFGSPNHTHRRSPLAMASGHGPPSSVLPLYKTDLKGNNLSASSWSAAKSTHNLMIDPKERAKWKWANVENLDIFLQEVSTGSP
ncbi:hypothetical protein AWJ20_2223 [Sugiyamaella lignohabitans]|uniref:Uncharacterized protein n=1 Tax=Sugiyamaella lignohabitans TaxID=796027 RepID=A0A167EYS1_9ASCO|nr:uncharacterized protein AWJ20_2223 [Sugiyamaella lignohabitans]ANB14618.1 hypothetical protein AWJ20_2223 [Sugiyamaella lignohabitans]